MTLRTKDASKILGLHPQTLRRWETEGKISPKRVNGQRRYDLNDINNLKKGIDKKDNRKEINYCRVSSKKQEGDLERQVKFMQKLFPGAETIRDIGSGVNFNRSGFCSLLEQICRGDVRKVNVSFKDRIARIGADLFERIAEIFGCEIFIVNNIETSPEEELVEDLIAITTSFSARIHGLRRYANKMSNDKIIKQKETSQNLEILDQGDN